MEGVVPIFKFIDCLCDDCKELYSFVYGMKNPMGQYLIFVGPKFFQARDDVFAVNSKVANLLHELSHFRDLCDTVDHELDAMKSLVSLVRVA